MKLHRLKAPKENPVWIYKQLNYSDLKDHTVYQLVCLSKAKSAKRGGWHFLEETRENRENSSR